jgi:hypothetical protein
MIALAIVAACSSGATDGGSTAASGGSAGRAGGNAGSGGNGGNTAGGSGGTGGNTPDGSAGAGGRGGSGGTGGNTPDGSAGTAGRSGSGGTGGNTPDGSAGADGRSGSGGTGGNTQDGSAGTAGSAGQSGSAGAAGSGLDSGGDASGACEVIATFETGLRPSRELFVDAAATGTGDGSAANPFANISQALAQAMAGTAVRIRPGTYAADVFVRNLAGTSTAPIWVGGVPGSARPVIAGGGQAFHFVRARYVIVHDLEVRTASSNGINADDDAQYANADAARFIVFRNLFIHDIGSGGNQDCLKLSGLNDYWVIDSEFQRCGGAGSGSGVDHVGCHRGLIARNVFSDLQGNGVQCKGGSDDIEIRRNRFANAGERSVNMGGSTGTEFFRPPLSTTTPNFEARNIRVVANTFTGSVVPLAFVGCVDCLALNNTLVTPTNWLLRILQETVTGGGYTFLPAQNGRFINNLVYFSRGDLSTYVNVGPNTQAATFQFANNLWYAHDMPSSSRPTDLPSPETGAVVGVDPQLQAPTSGDYRLGASSPAASAGQRATELRSDMIGRCYGDPPSIGAYER